MARTPSAYAIKVRKVELANGKQTRVYYYKLASMEKYKTTGKNTKKEATDFVLEQIEESKRLKIVNGMDISFKDFTKDFYTETCPYCMYKEGIKKPLSINSIKHYKSVFRGYVYNENINPFMNKLLGSITPADIQELYKNFVINKVPEGVYITTLNILRNVFFLAKKDRKISWIEHPLADRRTLRAKSERIDIESRGRLYDEEIEALFKTFDVMLREKEKEPQETKRIEYKYITIIQEPKPIEEKYEKDEIGYKPNLKTYFPFKTFRDKVLVFLTYSTGCRISEVSILKWKDIDFEKKFITFNKNLQYKKGDEIITGETKNKKPRVSPALDMLIIALLYWRVLSKYTKPDDYIFTKRDGSLFSMSAISEMFYATLTRIGISEEERAKRKITFHSLRHTANSKMIEEGVNPEIIRRSMGWGDVALQKVYTKLSQESLKQASSAIDNQFREQIKNLGKNIEINNIVDETVDNSVYEKIEKYKYDALMREKEEVLKALAEVVKERDELKAYNEEIRRHYNRAKESFNALVMTYETLTGTKPMGFYELNDLKPFTRKEDDFKVFKLLDGNEIKYSDIKEEEENV